MSHAGHRFNNELRYRGENHPGQTHLTPAYVLNPVREALGGTIGLDPCTTPENPVGAEHFIHPPGDGAAIAWWAKSIFVNPPYGKARERWVHRCIEAAGNGAKVILLIPAATDTRIFQEAVSTSSGVVFIQGRVKFGIPRPNGRQVAASHPSALVGWNVDLGPCGHLGVTVGCAGLSRNV
jgi:hypothetical protein